MYLVFDIGGTNIRVGVSRDGKNIFSSKIVNLTQDFEEGVAVLKTIAQDLGGEKIQAICGGIAGSLNRNKTMLVASPHIPGWINKPLKGKLEDEFGCPAFLENDCVLGGLAEATKGPGVNQSIVGYVAIGTGVGGVRIVDGKIDENSLGFEPGHQIIVPDGNPCNCGGAGHLETYVGGVYIEKIYHRKAEEIADTGIWDEISTMLAIGLNNTIVHWSPDMIILGGSVTQSIPLDLVNKHLKELLKIFPNPPLVVKATLGHEVGLLGALGYLKQNRIDKWH